MSEKNDNSFNHFDDVLTNEQIKELFDEYRNADNNFKKLCSQIMPPNIEIDFDTIKSTGIISQIYYDIKMFPRNKQMYLLDLLVAFKNSMEEKNKYSKKQIRDLYNKILWEEPVDSVFAEMEEVLQIIFNKFQYSSNLREIIELIAMIQNNKELMLPRSGDSLASHAQKELFLLTKNDDFKINHDIEFFIDITKSDSISFFHDLLYMMAIDFDKDVDFYNISKIDDRFDITINIGIDILIDAIYDNSFKYDDFNKLEHYSKYLTSLLKSNYDTIKLFQEFTTYMPLPRRYLVNSIKALLYNIKHFDHNYELLGELLKQLIELFFDNNDNIAVMVENGDYESIFNAFEQILTKKKCKRLPSSSPIKNI